MLRKLEKDAAIEKRSRTTGVNGAVHGPCTGKARFAAALLEMTPNHLATGYKSSTKTIAGRIFNQKKVVQKLDIDRGTKDMYCD